MSGVVTTRLPARRRNSHPAPTFGARFLQRPLLVLDAGLAVNARAARLSATNVADHVDLAARLDDHEIRLTRRERQDES